MTTQPQLKIDFSKPLIHFENNHESQLIFEANKDKFSNQCKIVFEAFLRGERLTTALALIKYGIGDLRRRVKDLRDIHGINVESEIQKGGYKEYFFTGVKF